ncbi:MAG: class I SAM-dependent methyltransferase [bacterium]
MAAEPSPEVGELAGLGELDLDGLLGVGDVGACCATLYEHPGVRWLLGDELHPGGEATTRRALELVALDQGDRLLDVACGQGASALLAVRERDCEAVGIDRGEAALARARETAQSEGLAGRVSFQGADAGALPFPDASFSALLCECSLSAFADKARAAAEMRRVLAPGGRVAISDVVVDSVGLPQALRGPLATIACVGDALDAAGYARLLESAAIAVVAVESHDAAAARLAERVEDRLRGARLLGLARAGEMVELARVARRAIDEGVLGYATFSGVRA